VNHLDAVHRANINSTDVSTVFMYSFFLANENAGVFEDYADLLLLLVVGIFEMMTARSTTTSTMTTTTMATITMRLFFRLLLLLFVFLLLLFA